MRCTNCGQVVPTGEIGINPVCGMPRCTAYAPSNRSQPDQDLGHYIDPVLRNCPQCLGNPPSWFDDHHPLSAQDPLMAQAFSAHRQATEAGPTVAPQELHHNVDPELQSTDCELPVLSGEDLSPLDENLHWQDDDADRQSHIPAAPAAETSNKGLKKDAQNQSEKCYFCFWSNTLCDVSTTGKRCTSCRTVYRRCFKEGKELYDPVEIAAANEICRDCVTEKRTCNWPDRSKPCMECRNPGDPNQTRCYTWREFLKIELSEKPDAARDHRCFRCAKSRLKCDWPGKAKNELCLQCQKGRQDDPRRLPCVEHARSHLRY